MGVPGDAEAVRAHLPFGEALVVRRTGDGREFAVTVDDAGTAAALLNTLAERRPETR